MVGKNIDLILKVMPGILAFLSLISYLWVGVGYLPKFKAHFVNCKKTIKRRFLKFFRNISITVISSKKNPYFNKNLLFSSRLNQDKYPGIQYIPEAREVMVTKQEYKKLLKFGEVSKGRMRVELHKVEKIISGKRYLLGRVLP